MVLERSPVPFALPRLDLRAVAPRRALANRLATADGAIAGALVLAVVVRAAHVLRHPFALNDGGLFYVMARDIQAAGFGLPAYSSYNGGDIPFAYPPLAMWLAAAVDSLTPLSLEDTFRILPLLGAAFAAYAFYRLAVVILPDRVAVAGAVAAFAVAPRAFIWLVMGGGLPRGLGLAFALLVLEAAWRLRTGPFDRRRFILATVFSGLTILTHLETAAFLAFSLALIAATAPRTGLPRLGLAGLAGLALAAPWWLLILARHGLSPFREAANHGGQVVAPDGISLVAIFRILDEPIYTSEPWLPVAGALGLVGIVAAIRSRDWFLPAWFVLVAALGMRGYLTFAMIPTSLLAGLAVARVIVPFFESAALTLPARASTLKRPALLVAACVLAVIAYAAVGAITNERGELTTLRPLPHADREAMAWVRANTSPAATFAVMPTEGWHADAPVEWFPALAGRSSIGTPQGYEWVPGEFRTREQLHWQLVACEEQDAACVASVLAAEPVDYLFVPTRAWEELRVSLRTSSSFRVVYDSGTTLILETKLP